MKFSVLIISFWILLSLTVVSCGTSFLDQCDQPTKIIDCNNILSTVTVENESRIIQGCTFMNCTLISVSGVGSSITFINSSFINYLTNDLQIIVNNSAHLSLINVSFVKEFTHDYEYYHYPLVAVSDLGSLNISGGYFDSGFYSSVIINGDHPDFIELSDIHCKNAHASFAFISVSYAPKVTLKNIFLENFKSYYTSIHSWNSNVTISNMELSYNDSLIQNSAASFYNSDNISNSQIYIKGLKIVDGTFYHGIILFSGPSTDVTLEDLVINLSKLELSCPAIVAVSVKIQIFGASIMGQGLYSKSMSFYDFLLHAWNSDVFIEQFSVDTISGYVGLLNSYFSDVQISSFKIQNWTFINNNDLGNNLFNLESGTVLLSNSVISQVLYLKSLANLVHQVSFKISNVTITSVIGPPALTAILIRQIKTTHVDVSDLRLQSLQNINHILMFDAIMNSAIFNGLQVYSTNVEESFFNIHSGSLHITNSNFEDYQGSLLQCVFCDVIISNSGLKRGRIGKYGIIGKSMNQGKVEISNCNFADMFQNPESYTYHSSLYLSAYGLNHRVTIRDSQFISPSKLYGETGFKFEEGVILEIENSLFMHHDELTHAVILIDNGELSRISNCSFINNRVVVGGSLQIYSTSVFVSNSRFLQNTGVYGGAISILGTADLSVSDCIFENNQASYGGAIWATSYSSLKFTGKNLFRYNRAANSGGAIFCYGNTEFHNLTIAEGNEAYLNGGFIILKNFARAIFHYANVMAMNNSAKNVGGFAFISDSSSFVMKSSLFENISNTANYGDFLFLDKMSDISISRESAITNFADKGILYVDEASSAYKIISSDQYTQLSNVLDLRGQPCAISLAATTESHYVLQFSSKIPPINVVAKDYFGKIVTNFMAPVFISVKETNGARLRGSLTKAILDLQTGVTSFDDLELDDSSIEAFALEFSAMEEQLRPIPITNVSAIVTIVYKRCDLEREDFDPDNIKCVPFRGVSRELRILITFLSASLTLISIIMLVMLYQNRDERIIKLNSFVFLVCINIGTIFSFISGLTVAIPYTGSCQIQEWFLNLGFSIVFTAMSIKTYRIKVLFQNNSSSQTRVAALKESTLMGWFVAIVFSFIVYLSIWTFLEPSYYQPKIVPNMYVLVEKCSSTTYGSIISVVRAILTLQLAYFAFAVRKTPTEFNESRYIGIVTYNWILFDVIVFLILQFTVLDPNVIFTIQNLQIIFSNFLTLVLMIGLKLFNCVKQNLNKSSKPSYITDDKTGRYVQKSMKGTDIQNMMQDFLRNFHPSNLQE